MIGQIRLVVVLALMLPITFLLMPIQLLAVYLKLELAKKIPIFFHSLFCRLIGIKVNAVGAVSDHPHVLLVSNHTSWADIVVLSSIAKVSFIAKREVATIPLAGILAKLQRSIFVNREKKRDAGRQVGEIHERMLDRDVMVLFAEGTTTDGHRIGELKSSLLGAAEMALKTEGVDCVHVQPMTICYKRCHGIILGRLMRARSSWPGDIDLAPHGADFIRRSAWDVEISFAEPIEFKGQFKRRELAQKCHGEMRKLYSKSAHGK